MILFDKTHKITRDEVRQQVNGYIDEAKRGMDVYKVDKSESVRIGKGIRENLKEEYHFYHLKKNEDLEREEYFPEYSAAIDDSYAKTTGQLTKDNVYSFLYDVEWYMKYWKQNSKYKDDNE